jgi:hypothetical protein
MAAFQFVITLVLLGWAQGILVTSHE